jgi:prepilin-type N-terminal cleavage/methylation domain-containing protein
MPREYAMKSGFTLIEMSIVLVIIGLIVGGILTGRDLIDATAQRAQIAQIEKYNVAVRTFQGKYGGLPGDLPDPMATQFGFQPRGQYAGEGDGNGVLRGNCGNCNGCSNPAHQGCGELAVFWQDLSAAGLIDMSIPTGACFPQTNGPSACTSVAKWLPAAKLGNGQYVYVMSPNNINYFTVQRVRSIGWAVESTTQNGAGINTMTVQQAYNIDKKADDGLPQSGSIIACDMDYDAANFQAVWAAGSSYQGVGGANCTASTSASSYNSYNCFDNSSTAGVTQTYSLTQNANSLNCALSFKFQ